MAVEFGSENCLQTICWRPAVREKKGATNVSDVRRIAWPFAHLRHHCARIFTITQLPKCRTRTCVQR